MKKPRLYSLHVTYPDALNDDLVSLSDAVWCDSPRYFDFAVHLGTDVLMVLKTARVDFHNMTLQGPAALEDMIRRANESIIAEWNEQ